MLAILHPRYQTTYVDNLDGAVVGVLAIFADSVLTLAHQNLTASIVTLSVFGALTAYVISMASLFRLRHTAADMARPYCAPGYPWAPGLALCLAVTCLGAMIWLNLEIFLIFVLIMGVGYGVFRMVGPRSLMPTSDIADRALPDGP